MRNVFVDIKDSGTADINILGEKILINLVVSWLGVLCIH